MKLTNRQKVIIAALVPYFITLLILAHIPEPKLVLQAHISDKIAHFLAYMNLVFLLWFSISPDKKVTWRRPAAWLIFFAAVAYGGIDEIVQPYFGRTKDLWDFIANLAGASTGMGILSFLDFWQALLAVSAITIFGLTNLAKTDLSKLMPIVNAVFHIFAYGGFALVWARFSNLYLPLRTAFARFSLAVGVPIGFLFAVKAGSLLLDRHFAMSDLIFSVLAIVVSTIVALRLQRVRTS